MALEVDAVSMGNIKRCECDPFDSGQRAIWVFEGDKQSFAAVLDEDVMEEMVRCLEKVMDMRQRAVSFVKSAPLDVIRAIDKYRTDKGK